MGKEFKVNYADGFITIDFLKEVKLDFLKLAFEASGKYEVKSDPILEGVLNIFRKGNRAIPLASIYAKGAERKSIFLADNGRNRDIAEELKGLSEVSQAINTLVLKLYERREPKYTGNSSKSKAETETYERPLKTTSPLFFPSGKTALLRNNIGAETRALMHKLGTPAYSPKTDELRLSLNQELSHEALSEILQGYTHDGGNHQSRCHVKNSENAIIATISPKKIVFHHALDNAAFIRGFINKLWGN